MTNYQTIVVAGMGRCGTTLVFDAIRKKNEFVRDLQNLNNPDFIRLNVIKTHDFPPTTLPPNTKCIYMFGNPYHIVFSSHGPKVNHHEHYLNMHSEPSSRFKFTWEDTLQLQKNFTLWHQPQPFPLLTLRYETLWQNIHVLNEFLGFEVQLPKQKPRETHFENPQLANQMWEVRRTYEPLHNIIEQAPNAKIWEVKK